MDNIKEFIANRITELRYSKNLSARKLSQDLLLGDNYINQVENRKTLPSYEILKQICDYFGISVCKFFDDKFVYPIQYQELFLELNKLDKDEIDKIIQIVKLITAHKK